MFTIYTVNVRAQVTRRASYRTFEQAVDKALRHNARFVNVFDNRGALVYQVMNLGGRKYTQF